MCSDIKQAQIDECCDSIDFIKKIEISELGMYYYDCNGRKYGIIIDGELKPIPINKILK